MKLEYKSSLPIIKISKSLLSSELCVKPHLFAMYMPAMSKNIFLEITLLID